MARTDCLVYVWDFEAVEKMAGEGYPAMAAAWRNLVLYAVGSAFSSTCGDVSAQDLQTQWWPLLMPETAFPALIVVVKICSVLNVIIFLQSFCREVSGLRCSSKAMQFTADAACKMSVWKLTFFGHSL